MGQEFSVKFNKGSSSSPRVTVMDEVRQWLVSSFFALFELAVVPVGQKGRTSPRHIRAHYALFGSSLDHPNFLQLKSLGGALWS